MGETVGEVAMIIGAFITFCAVLSNFMFYYLQYGSIFKPNVDAETYHAITLYTTIVSVWFGLLVLAVWLINNWNNPV